MRVLALVVGSLSSVAAYAVPTVVTHQVRVLDASGEAAVGPVSLTIELHASESSTTPLWSEDHDPTLSDGYAALTLGSRVPLDSAVLAANPSPWVAVMLEGAEVMRQPLTAVPYARVSEAATTLSRTDCAAGETLVYDGSAWVCTPVSSGSGNVYPRWGRTSCGGGSTLVYAGWMAGGAWSHGGRSANYHCLPPNPQYDTSSTANQNGSLLYGVEYRTSGYGVSELNGVSGAQARCAICETEQSKILEIPGTQTCPAGWT